MSHEDTKPVVSWDIEKLEQLLGDTEAGFLECLRYDEHHPEEPSTHEIQGYFMYRLLECKPGAKRVEIHRTIEGPLFAALEKGKR